MTLRRLLLPLAAALACAGPSGDTDTDTDATPGTSTPDPTSTPGTPDPTSTTDPTSTDPTSAASTDPSTDPASTPSTDPSTDPSTLTGDETTDTPPPACDHPLCDNFDDLADGAAPDPARWTVTSPNCMGTGTLAITTAEAHSGSGALRVDGGGGYCDHVFIAHTAALADLGEVVYARVWLRLEAALADGHVTFLTLRDASSDKDLRMGGQSKIFMWNREQDDATLPALSPTGISLSTAPTPGQWTCVEFMLHGAAGLLTTWVDEVEVAGLVVDDSPTPDIDQQWHGMANWAPVPTDFKLGWESYAGQTMTLYFDDVALDSERIGCGP